MEEYLASKKEIRDQIEQTEGTDIAEKMLKERREWV